MPCKAKKNTKKKTKKNYIKMQNILHLTFGSRWVYIKNALFNNLINFGSASSLLQVYVFGFLLAALVGNS